MKKEITPEIRQRIFALYFGQKIMRDNTINKQYPIHGANIDFDPEGAWLEVKPLSSTTDEDAIEVAKIEDPEFNDPLGFGRRLIKNFHRVLFTTAKWIPIIDYLRSKGYALPAFGYSVDELVEAGVFKLKEEE